MPYYAKAEQPPRITRSYRAALYIRLSREDGDKTESDSVVNQKRLLTHFADSQPDIESYQYYVDDGWSGANFNRPDFLRMMSDVYAQKVDCVIVKDSSRFGRNASESGRYIGEVFPRLRVRYIAVNDAIDSGRSQGVAIDFLNNSMRGMINEYYVAANSESIRSTLDMERRRGLFIGSFAKYGYHKDPDDHHKLLIDEEAADVVRRIYRMYLGGSGIRTIVRWLNDNGIPNPSTYKCRSGLNFQSRAIGKSPLWSDKTVRRILQDEMYIGNMVQGKNRKVSYKDKAVIPLPQEEWIRVRDTHEAIIGKEDFDRVQRMLQSGAKSSPISGEISLFSGLLRCANCGHALIKKVNRNPDKTYVYYRCSTYCKCKGACSAHSIRYEKLYDTVLACIQKMVEIAVDADEVLQELQSKHKNDNSVNLQTQIESQERELQRVKQMLADLYPDYKSGILNADQYLMNKEKYERQQQQLEANIDNLKASANDPDVPPQTNDFVEHFKHHGNISTLTRPLLTELIEQITVHKDGALDITFNFRDTFEEAKELAQKQSA
ncbi:MAG: recombinase family protein [Ruminococcus sp.]|nr:recombinase family protein [Ruminococcus sp.]